nr:uncharacterized protein LOC104094093 isoform X2 [Nicotiana tomentosiformis]
MRGMRVQLSLFVEHASQRFEYIKTNQNQFQTQLDDVKDANRKFDFIISSMDLSQRAVSNSVMPFPTTKSTDQKLTPMTSKSAQLTAIVIAHSVQAIAEAGGVSGGW